MSYSRQLTIRVEVHQQLRQVAFHHRVAMKDLASAIIETCLKDDRRITELVKGLPKVAS